MMQSDSCASKIFISHAWEDKPFVVRLEKKLKQLGLTVWVDHSGIRAGDLISINISDALAQCNVMLLVWSRAAGTSQWVSQEWGAANSNQKKIIPCKLDDTQLPALLADNAYINFSNFEQGFSILWHTLKDSFDSQSPKPAKTRENDNNNAVNDIRTKIDIAVKLDMLEIELKIDREFNSYTTEEQNHLLRAIGEFLGMNRDLKIKQIRSGSVVISLKLSGEQTEKLYSAVKSGRFNQYNVVDAQLSKDYILLRESIDACLEKVVSGKNRERNMLIFKLMVYDNLSAKQIAAMPSFDGMTPYEIDVQISRIRVKVRNCLKKSKPKLLE